MSDSIRPGATWKGFRLASFGFGCQKPDCQKAVGFVRRDGIGRLCEARQSSIGTTSGIGALDPTCKMAVGFVRCGSLGSLGAVGTLIGLARPAGLGDWVRAKSSRLQAIRFDEKEWKGPSKKEAGNPGRSGTTNPPAIIAGEGRSLFQIPDAGAANAPRSGFEFTRFGGFKARPGLVGWAPRRGRNDDRCRTRKGTCLPGRRRAGRRWAPRSIRRATGRRPDPSPEPLRPGTGRGRGPD